AAAKLCELPLVRERSVGLDVECQHDGAVRHVERRLVRAQDDAVRTRYAVAVLLHDALRVGIEEADTGNRQINASARIRREVVQNAAEALERLAVERAREHLALGLELDDSGAEPPGSEEQRAVIA